MELTGKRSSERRVELFMSIDLIRWLNHRCRRRKSYGCGVGDGVTVGD